MPGIASSSPPVLMMALADATSTIRVGSGGVMLPNHAPLVVAEQFGMLEALHPGRIDLGIGRAPGTDPITAAALRRSADPLSADDFPRQLGELLGFFDGDVPARRPATAASPPSPARATKPAIWLLGSSDYTAQLAGVLGLPFSFAHHFSPRNTIAGAASSTARASGRREYLDEPYAMVGVRRDLRRGRRAGPLARRARRGSRSSGCAPATRAASRRPRRRPSTSSPRSRRQSVISAVSGSAVIGGPETVQARPRAAGRERPAPTS